MAPIVLAASLPVPFPAPHYSQADLGPGEGIMENEIAPLLQRIDVLGKGLERSPSSKIIEERAKLRVAARNSASPWKSRVMWLSESVSR